MGVVEEADEDSVLHINAGHDSSRCCGGNARKVRCLGLREATANEAGAERDPCHRHHLSRSS